MFGNKTITSRDTLYQSVCCGQLWHRVFARQQPVLQLANSVTSLVRRQGGPYRALTAHFQATTTHTRGRPVPQSGPHPKRDKTEISISQFSPSTPGTANSKRALQQSTDPLVLLVRSSFRSFHSGSLRPVFVDGFCTPPRDIRNFLLFAFGTKSTQEVVIDIESVYICKYQECLYL